VNDLFLGPARWGEAVVFEDAPASQPLTREPDAKGIIPQTLFFKVSRRRKRRFTSQSYSSSSSPSP
jgi:hypothetical protein